MEDFIDETNVLDIWQLVEPLCITNLRSACKKFVETNFETLMGDAETKNQLFAWKASIFEEILKSGDLLIRDPQTKLLTYADEREKLVISLIRDYCAFNSGREEMAPILLQNCVNWMHLAAVEDEGSLCEGFDERVAEVITKMLHIAKKGLQIFRGLLLSSTGGVYVCSCT